MKLNIQIEMTNAAFAENPTTEIKRILSKLCDEISNESKIHDEIIFNIPEKLRDINGNTVGHCTVGKEFILKPKKPSGLKEAIQKAQYRYETLQAFHVKRVIFDAAIEMDKITDD